MPITPTKLDFPLVSAKPTDLLPGNLKTQLNALGYNCPLTSEESLKKYIAAGIAEVPDGGSYLVAILSLRESVEARAAALSKIEGTTVHSAQDIAFTDQVITLKSFNGQVKEYYLERVNGSYAIPEAANMPRRLSLGDRASWSPTYIKVEKLSTIADRDNFDKLWGDNFKQFKARSGHERGNNTIQDTDVNTIRGLLAELVTSMSSKVMYDLKKSDVLPILVNRLGPIDTTTPTFKIEEAGFVTIWANSPDGKVVEALGVINSNWVITGENKPGSDAKKNGHSPVHTTNYTIETRSVVYSEDSFIDDDYNYVAS
jgi:hypothetical protein